MNREIKKILDRLNEKRGFDFSGYRYAMLERRIGKRLTETRCDNYAEYTDYLKSDPHELDHLLDALTINVSRFFRDTLTFEFISNQVLTAIISGKIETNDHSLRVWSAGCSTGEEPYGIAILLNELLEKEDSTIKLHIFATDIDEGAIEKARQALYPPESIKNVTYGILKKYFVTDGESFRLISSVKEAVTFSIYDMMDKGTYAPPESIFGHFDMVLCRNLLIYFQVEYQDIIFDKLYRSLAKDGYLVLGEAEIPTIKFKKYFRKVNECCHIYKKIQESMV